ncbi:MAG: ABC transporter permease, partial [Rhizobium giardinii]
MAVDTFSTEHPAHAPGWKKLATMREAGLIAIILALCIVMSFASQHFLTLGNFRAMLMSFSVEGIVV